MDQNEASDDEDEASEDQDEASDDEDKTMHEETADEDFKVELKEELEEAKHVRYEETVIFDGIYYMNMEDYQSIDTNTLILQQQSLV